MTIYNYRRQYLFLLHYDALVYQYSIFFIAERVSLYLVCNT
jgi:hypothetical protein